MLLRRSGELKEERYNLGGVTKVADGEVGVKNEAMLLEIAEAIFYEDDAALIDVRTRGEKVLGRQALVDAIAVASGFNGITKVANATGIPLDERTEEITIEMRESTKIDDYSDEHKASLFG
jgi:hypothetical protein